ncbi:membrane protein [Clostridium sp. DMHC 10]|uniref:sensor histidine kinase n=1 Tax=Clostridium sp. DMHC 10 TaxID=747377 RepID=UPI00069FAD54|nr:HAMP domain-containing sensor histidine kinase [Clostridium sp. DMHC 10]KOF57266.1 membrane protein [Clostridium sp. DMHC 10]
MEKGESSLKGIRARLLGSYLFLITVTVVSFELFFIVAVDKYYYNNIENLLLNQIKVSANFYDMYLSTNTLKENVQNNADVFWNNTHAEVQIIDKSGNMLMDSIGNFTEEKVKSKDIKKALQGEAGKVIERDENSKEKILCISYPLKSKGKIEGVLRFITSVQDVDMTIIKISFILILIGICIIAIGGISSMFLSNSIVKPLREITEMAKKISSGNFNERIVKKRDDEIGELSDTINVMADEILKNDNLKNEFMASMSHELRTPLTSIKGWASTIRTGNLEDKEEMISGLNIIETESDRLSKLVEELLDFSKFISGKIVLKRNNVNIVNTILYIQKQMSLKALRNNIKFMVTMDDNIPIVLVDENRIKQLLINILDNAFKFTEENGTVELKAKTKDDNLIIIVKDSGIGIPESDLPRVTEKFFKGKSSKSSNGIGLSICKEIVELHSGKLEINSKLGKGTEVRIILPIL